LTAMHEFECYMYTHDCVKTAPCRFSWQVQRTDKALNST